MKIIICIVLLLGAICAVYDAVVLQDSDEDLDLYEIKDDK